MHSSRATIITKADGEREYFEPDKLYSSLVNSGAGTEVSRRITKEIGASLSDGDKTRDIYKRAFTKLRHIEKSIAARYSVKRALLELGPSGYPFELFLAEMYKKLGYETKTRVLVQGRCVEHELDVLATKDDERIAAEVKFHNNHGVKSDLKVALYVHARFEDIAGQSGVDSETDFTDRMLITNTKFTKQVELYSACVGLRLVSWDYPAKGNLRELIELAHVHPVSCLTSISKATKKQLMDKEVVLCRQIKENMDVVEGLGLSRGMKERLLREINDLCV